MSPARKPSNQELRTRKALLEAASRLTKRGRKPTMDEVAEEALVSRATAYRHFPSVDVLLTEAPADDAMITPEAILSQFTSSEPEQRVDEAEAAVHDVMYRNEAQLRIMLAHAIARARDDDGVPRRQNRRGPLIEAALAPARSRFRGSDYEKLCAALALMFGPESMIVFQDVLHLDAKKARAVKSWAVRALVRAALKGSDSKAKA